MPGAARKACLSTNCCSGVRPFALPLKPRLPALPSNVWPTPRCAMMHRAAMLEFEGKSYRLKEAASRIALNAAVDP